jgi:hypothetical protein
VNECGDVGGGGVEGGRVRDEWAAEPASRGEEKRGAHCTTTALGSRQMRAARTAQCDSVLGEIEGEDSECGTAGACGCVVKPEQRVKVRR